MKKVFIFLAIAGIAFSCKQQQPAEEMVMEVMTDPNMETFEKNVETVKATMAAFCAKDYDKMSSYLTDDFIWSPPSVGQDSLPKAEYEKAMKGFMEAYNDITLTEALYYAGLDEDQKPNGDVRVYGLWKSKHASSGKDSMLKYYGVMFFNEEGKIVHTAEWYDTADLMKEF